MEKKPLSHWVLFGLGLFFAYTGLAILITWPLVDNLTHVLPGASGDTLLHYWNGWAAKQALSQGQSPLFTNLLFYPDGVSLVTHNMAWFQIGPWLLLERFLNGIAAYNLTLLVNLTFCGIAAFILAFKLTENLKAAFLAGLVYMAWPFRLSQLDHPNLLATQWIPIFMLFLILTLENGLWRDAVLTAVSLALIGYGRWQLLIPAAIMGLIFVLWHWKQWWPKGQRDRLLKLGISGCLAAIMLLPPAILLLQEQQRDPGAADLFRGGEESIMQADLLAFVTPSNGHFLFREVTEPIYDKYYDARFNSRRYSPYIGLTTLFLIIMALIKKRRASVTWLLMALVLLLLAMGPLLKINGETYPGFPMLYRMLEPVQVIRLMRVPDRFNMFLALPASVLAAFGTAVILQRIRSMWVAVSVYVLLLVLILFEYLVIPVPLHKVPEQSPFSQRLAGEEGFFAVLNLPVDPLKAKNYMFEQITHQRPMMQGNMSRIPPSAYATFDSNPWLNTLRHEVEMDPNAQNVSRQLAALAEDGVRYIIMHKNLVGADRIQHWQRYLMTKPVYDDNEIIAYRTEPQVGEDFSLDQELIPGFGPIRVLISANCIIKGQTLEVDVGWGNAVASAQNFEAKLALVDKSGRMSFEKTFPFSDRSTEYFSAAHTLFWEYYQLQPPQDLETSVYSLELSLHDPTRGEATGEPYKLQEIVVQDNVCQYQPADNEAVVNAVFGNQLRLLAYEFEQEDQIDIRLFWQAATHMNKDYKIFIHVFDLATAVPVAQDDAMPHRNAYPTRFWGLGEIVEDQIKISLQDVPPGTYGLAIGVYDPNTGERLEVIDGEGIVADDGRLVLPDRVTVP